MASEYAYIGSLSKESDGGIYRIRIDGGTGKMEMLNHYDEVACGFYLRVSNSLKYLYSTHVTDIVEGVESGVVCSYRLDAEKGELSFISKESTGGKTPCYIGISDGVGSMLVANYGSGTITSLPISKDGRLGGVRKTEYLGSALDFEGNCEDLKPHCVTSDPSNSYILVTALGADEVTTFKWSEKGELKRASTVKLPKGSGPRHIVFHPIQPVVYVINELSNSIHVCEYDPETGKPTPIQEVSSLPEGYEGRTWCGDICISESGRFLYATNRGHHSIARFTVSQKDGKLKREDSVSCGGEYPWSLAFAQNENLLLVTNKNSHSVESLFVDPKDGFLKPTGESLSIPDPIGIAVLPSQ